MTGQQLKNSILQEAIQGRLVPNVLQPGEKTGAELLQDILAERQKKENTEKGKKAKKLTLSTIEEEPWELPEGWCWCKLGDVISLLSGRDLEPDKYNATHNGIPYITGASNFENGSIIINRWTQKPVSISTRGDLLITCKGTVGELAFNNIGDIHIARQIMAISAVIVNPKFIQVFLKAKVNDLNAQANGVIPGISREDILFADFPLPPISIQKAIVAKIEELFPLVDEYDKAAGELKVLNESLPDKLRKSVLQEAIHGTLVPNDIPDGEATAQELLQQILKERQDRENKEKGKKAKKLTLSTIEEEPWELPEGWCWCQIGDIFDHSAGKSLNSSKQSVGKVYQYLTTSNVYWEGINFDKVKEMPFTEEEYKKSSAIKNDILVCEGGDVGRSCIWTYDYTIGLQNHVHRLRSIKDTYVKFFFYVLMYFKATNIISAKGIGIGGFSANALKCLSIPLPPISIQHRIVEKIDTLFAEIDGLKFQ